MNYKITLAYDGTNYSGWQLQPNKITIQGMLTEALEKIEGERLSPQAAGRTDAGVHAIGQVVSFKLRNDRNPHELLKALNGNLPRDIRALDVNTVDDSFHARIYAKGKTYRYSIYNAEVMNPMLERYAHHFPYKLNLERFTELANELKGTHDFSMFSLSQCDVKTFVRTIHNIEIKTDGSLIKVYFSGNGFLRYQVRKMVGTLLLAVNNRLPTNNISELLKIGDRKHSGKPAPARGLTLIKVEY